MSGCVFASAQTLGRINAGLPRDVQLNQPFQVAVSVTPTDPSFNQPVKIFAGRNPKVTCDPSEFTITPGQIQTVKTTVETSASGLAVVYFYADNWEPADIPVVVGGVGAKLTTDLRQTVESKTVNSFVVSIVDKNGNPVRLDANARLSFDGSKVLLYSDQEQLWRENVQAAIKIGETKSIPIKLKADSWAADTGVLRMQLQTVAGYSVIEESIAIQISPPWYVPLMCALAGGLGYSIWQLLRRFLSAKKKLTRRFLVNNAAKALLLGFGAGMLAYLLAEWNVFGIKTDPSGLRGYLILGLLFSYVGADWILKISTKRS